MLRDFRFAIGKQSLQVKVASRSKTYKLLAESPVAKTSGGGIVVGFAI